MSTPSTDVIFDPLAQTHLNWPPEMVVAIAQGLEDPEDVARRFGWEGRRWEMISTNPAFLRAVEAQRKELEANGWVLVAKAKLGAELIQDELIRIGASANTTPAQKLAIYEALCKTGDVLPKQKVNQGATGPAFSISINLDPATVRASVKKVDVIDVDAK